MPIKSLIRTIPDYPKPGVLFRDITTLLQDPNGLRISVEQLCAKHDDASIDKVAGIEARGLILGGAVAYRLGTGFVPVRKRGKLPGKTIGRDYELEYGTDRVEIHADAINPGERILVVDDLLATGGTAEATIALLEDVGAEIVSCSVVIDLPDLGGRERLETAGYKVHSLCAFEGE